VADIASAILRPAASNARRFSLTFTCMQSALARGSRSAGAAPLVRLSPSSFLCPRCYARVIRDIDVIRQRRPESPEGEMVHSAFHAMCFSPCYARAGLRAKRFLRRASEATLWGARYPRIVPPCCLLGGVGDNTPPESLMFLLRRPVVRVSVLCSHPARRMMFERYIARGI